MSDLTKENSIVKTFRISEGLDEEIQRIVKDSEKNQSEILREFVERGLKAYKVDKQR